MSIRGYNTADGAGYSAETRMDTCFRDSLGRELTDVIVERSLREALIRLNPSIAEKPERADEVIYRLRTIWLASHSTGLVAANQEFEKWLKNDKSCLSGRTMNT